MFSFTKSFCQCNTHQNKYFLVTQDVTCTDNVNETVDSYSHGHRDICVISNPDWQCMTSCMAAELSINELTVDHDAKQTIIHPKLGDKITPQP